MFKLNNKNTRATSRFGVFIANFEHISQLFLMFLLLTLNKQMVARMSEPGTCLVLENLLSLFDFMERSYQVFYFLVFLIVNS